MAVGPVRRAIEELQIAGMLFEELANPSAVVLQKRVQQFRPQVLHFLAHGKFLGESGAFALLDQQGNALWSDAQSFSNYFQAWRPGLVVLQSCESAKLSDLQPFSGGAAWLARRQIPAVVAMRYPFTQKTGWIFAREFYTQLGNDKPVDVAAQSGRHSLAYPEGTPPMQLLILLRRALDALGSGRLFPEPEKTSWMPKPVPLTWQKRKSSFIEKTCLILSGKCASNENSSSISPVMCSRSWSTST